MRLRLLLTMLAAANVLAAVPASASHTACRNDDNPARSMSDEGIGLTADLGLASGRYALPRGDEPTQMVVMLHGYGNNSCSWRNHLRQAAGRGAVAVAMDYTGQDLTTDRGWRVNEGAADTIAATKYFMRAYPSIEDVFVLGISMGGNASGLTIAHPDAAGLFDYWVGIEGVHNLTEEYLIARSVAPFNTGAAEATYDIEQELGGPLESNPEAYLASSNITRADDMAANGLKGAVLVHGVDDGLVPYGQSQEMAAALVAAGVPTEMYTVLGRGDGEAGTTATGIAAGAIDPSYQSPLAGHGWEGSDTQHVIRTGFEQLWALMAGAQPAAFDEHVVHDGQQLIQL